MDDRLAMVKSDEWNADEWGNEWDIYYTLVVELDDDNQKVFNICRDDGRGNGDYLCRGYDEMDMRFLLSKLGEPVEVKTYPYRRTGNRRMGHEPD